LSSKRILVTGATGLLGPYVCEAFADYELITTARKNADHSCDLTDASAVEELFTFVCPDAVIHLMALTDVDYCEEHPDDAQKFNGESVDHIVRVLDRNAMLVYLSTDQVYPGDRGPYKENMETLVKPVNMYGRSKLSGEKATRQHSRSLCLRTNLFGPSRTEGRVSLSDFVTKMLSEEKPVNLFQDILFSPLHMKTLAHYLRMAVDQDITGIYNLGCREGMSKAVFGLTIARRLGLSTASVTIGDSVGIPGRALRPLDMRMDPSLFESAIGEAMPTLETEIGKL
jgi:dTDP-4-dehydrorhamnose reductase